MWLGILAKPGMQRFEVKKVFMLPQLRHHAAAFSLISKTLSAPFFQRCDWKQARTEGRGPYPSLLV